MQLVGWRLKAARHAAQIVMTYGKRCLPHGHAISGVVSADQPRSVSWERRYIKIAGMASAKLLDEVRERLAVPLQID